MADYAFRTIEDRKEIEGVVGGRTFSAGDRRGLQGSLWTWFITN